MNLRKEHICRLCLRVAKYEFQKIDNSVKQLFNTLLLKLDLDITKDPIICQDCSEVAKTCLQFKSTCIDTERLILSLSIDTEKVKHCIKLTYAEKEHIATVEGEDLDICRFCLTGVERNNFVKLDTLMGDTTFEMLTKYISEMDFNITETPIICDSCRENVKVYFRLILNCLNVETKIKAYCKEGRNDDMYQIKLRSVQRYLFKDTLECPLICKIKTESNTPEPECIYHEAYSGLIKQAEEDIKDEEINLNKRVYKNLEKLIDEFPSKKYESDNIFYLNTREHNTEGYACAQQVQGISMEEGSIHVDDLVSVQEGVTERTIYKCSLCPYGVKQKGNLNSHMLIHKNISEIKTFKCSFCAYEAKYKGYLKSHMLVHKDVSELQMFKCSFCTYESKYKHCLKTHMLVHKDVSEIKMYKCSLCAYETKRRGGLNAHMIVHKDVSEIKMFKCLICAHEFKQRSHLTRHMLVHKDVSEIKMLKCSLCSYKAKRKSHLKSHMLVHKDTSEVQMYKCSSCAYEAKYKSYVKSHMLVHKGVSEIKMHKCLLCTFETKHKGYLKSHMLVHKDISEIKMHKCLLCAYETKFKFNLKIHMVVHKDVSEIQMFKCSFCAYESKYKSCLKTHMILHKDASEIEMHKCPRCAYETKHKGSFNVHMMVHKKHFRKKNVEVFNVCL